MRAIDADACESYFYEHLDDNGMAAAMNAINDMPTIEPQRKKGKWLFKERREPVYDLSGVKTWGIAYMCSECGFIHTVIEDFGQYAYCPNSNCGAEMEGQDE